MLVASLVISALLVALYHSIKRSLPEKHAKRVLLQEKLRQFAIANREGGLTSLEIERFWTQTCETYSLCRKTAISELRNELYNRAVQLLHTQQLLTGYTVSTEQQTQLMKLHAETVQWFSVALVQMDAVFIEEKATTVSVQDVWAEFIRLICHSIRA